jgi:ribosomal protein S27AE
VENLYIQENRDLLVGHKLKRSHLWQDLEQEFKRNNPVCKACGSSVNLNVHHKKPFHLFPELELDYNNLITLCMDGDKDCHLKLGHGGNFRAYNPNVIEDVAVFNAGYKLSSETLVKAKSVRKFER